MQNPEPPPLTELELLAVEADIDIREGSFNEVCDRIREHLRRQIELAHEEADHSHGANEGAPLR